MPSAEKVEVPVEVLIEAAARLAGVESKLLDLNDGEDCPVSMDVGDTAGVLLNAAAGVVDLADDETYRHPTRVEVYARAKEKQGDAAAAERIRTWGDVRAFWGASDDDLRHYAASADA